MTDIPALVESLEVRRRRLAAERMRRLRLRRAHRRIPVPAEIHLRTLEQSIELGLLTDAEVDDPRAVGRVVAEIFTQAIGELFRRRS